MKMDYKTLTLKEMLDYVKANHNDAKSLKAFAAAAVKDHKEQFYVDVKDENGNPVTYTDKNGKTKVKKKRQDKEGGKVTKVKSVLDAKKYFYETYKDEIEFTNAPKAKQSDALMDELLSYL